MVTGAMMEVTGRDQNGSPVMVMVLITALAITTWKTLLSQREREERHMMHRLVVEEGVFLSIGHLVITQLRSRVKAKGMGEVAVEDGIQKQGGQA